MPSTDTKISEIFIPGPAGRLEAKYFKIKKNTSTIDLLIEYTGSTGTKQVCLERINLSTDSAAAITEKKHPILLDRRRKEYTGSVNEALIAPTSAGAEIVVDDKGNVLTNSQAAAYVSSGGTVFRGFNYDFIATCQSCRYLPYKNSNRKIPRTYA